MWSHLNNSIQLDHSLFNRIDWIEIALLPKAVISIYFGRFIFFLLFKSNSIYLLNFFLSVDFFFIRFSNTKKYHFYRLHTCFFHFASFVSIYLADVLFFCACGSLIWPLYLNNVMYIWWLFSINALTIQIII